MEQIKLIRPTIEYSKDIMELRKEILLADDKDAFAGCCMLELYPTAEQWLIHIEKMGKQETCPEGFVPSDVYIAVRVNDNRIVGIIDLRHSINTPILSSWGGHIGYTVRPSERGKGYAKDMLRLNLHNCRKLGIDRVMITCHDFNSASEKVIIANGGVFENEITVDGEHIRRYWITLN